MIDFKEAKPKTCWFLVEDTTDCYYSEQIRRVFKVKPTKKKLIETFKDNSLDLWQFKSAKKEEVESAVEQILDGKEIKSLFVREEIMY
jgi:hypothetical protein